LKEIMAEQNGNNGSPELLAPPELLDEEEAPEWLEVCVCSWLCHF
jgi:hypothetical protein